MYSPFCCAVPPTLVYSTVARVEVVPTRVTVMVMAVQSFCTEVEAVLNWKVEVGDGVGVGVGVAVGVGVGVPTIVAQFSEPTDGQLPTTNSVPPRVMSRRPSVEAVNVDPRKPASTEPALIAGPLVTSELSLLTATLTVMV